MYDIAKALGMEPFSTSVPQATENHSPEVRARIAVMDQNARRNADAINTRLKPHFRRLNRKTNALLASNRSKDAKFYAMWEIADEINSFNGKNVPCKIGCSHCCHIAVAITQAEAEAIGRKIGRTPERKVKLREHFHDAKFGYDTPCPFLKDNRCSIYDYRPLVCRNHVSADVDSLLCQLHEGLRPVPLLDRYDFHLAELKIAQPASSQCLADIREFFPPSSKELT